MSTTQLIEELKHLDNRQRLAVIEAASRLIRDDLASAPREDQRLRDQAAALKDLYEAGGELTEWTSLDAQDIGDASLPQ